MKAAPTKSKAISSPNFLTRALQGLGRHSRVFLALALLLGACDSAPTPAPTKGPGAPPHAGSPVAGSAAAKGRGGSKDASPGPEEAKPKLCPDGQVAVIPPVGEVSCQEQCPRYESPQWFEQFQALVCPDPHVGFEFERIAIELEPAPEPNQAAWPTQTAGAEEAQLLGPNDTSVLIDSVLDTLKPNQSELHEHVEVVFVIDHSTSMDNARTLIANSITELLKRLNEEGATKIKFGVVTFSDSSDWAGHGFNNIAVRFPMTVMNMQHAQNLINMLMQIRLIGGSEPVGLAVKKGLALFSKEKEVTKGVFVITDDDGLRDDEAKSYNIEDAQAAGRKKGIPIKIDKVKLR